jgi:hypothetical protein
MKDDFKALMVNFPICLFSMGGAHHTNRLQAMREDFSIRRRILKANYATCALLFCVHLLHHYLRLLVPSINRKLIYRS